VLRHGEYIALTHLVLSESVLSVVEAEVRFLINVCKKVQISIDSFYIITQIKHSPFAKLRPFLSQAMMDKYENVAAGLTAYLP
jgi:hypothetical protein